MQVYCRLLPFSLQYWDMGFKAAKAKKTGYDLDGEKQSGPAYFHMSLRDAAKEAGNSNEIDISLSLMLTLVGGRRSIAELFDAPDAPPIKLKMPAYLECQRMKVTEDRKQRRVVRLIACGKSNPGGIDLTQGGGSGRQYYPITNRFNIPQDHPLQTLTAAQVGAAIAEQMAVVTW